MLTSFIFFLLIFSGHYGASKAGLVGLYESLTYELGSPSTSTCGVRTLLVCPGQLRTPLFQGLETPSTILAPVLDPSDIADSIISAMENGQIGEIDFPFYSRFMPWMRTMPWHMQEVVRYLSGTDRAMQRYSRNPIEGE